LAKARQDADRAAVADAARTPAADANAQAGLGHDSGSSAVLEIDDAIDDEIFEPVEKDNLTAREIAFLSRIAPPAAE
jgi:hypothetical protein